MDYTIPQSASLNLPLHLQSSGSEAELNDLYEQYRERILKLSQEIQKVLNLSLQSFKNIDPRFQPRILIRLRSEATNKIDALTMPEERKSYLLHQLANCHDIDNLVDLLREINNAQLRTRPVFTKDDLDRSIETEDLIIQNIEKDKNFNQDLLLIIITQQGLLLAKQSFSTFAGHLEASPKLVPEIKKTSILPANFQLNGKAALLELKDSLLLQRSSHQVHSLQTSVDQLREMGVSIIGLNRLCSQVSEQGLLLDPRRTHLSTGDNLLCGLLSQHVLKKLQQLNLPVEGSSLGILGIFHPNMPILGNLLADSLKKIIIFHHSPVELSLKLQQSVFSLLSEISKSEEESSITEIIRHLWQNQVDIVDFLSKPLVKRVFEVTSDLNRIRETQILLTDSSPLTQMLNIEMLKQTPVHLNIEVTPQALVETEINILQSLNLNSAISKKDLIRTLTHSAISQGYNLDL